MLERLPPLIWANFKLLKHEKSVFYVASFTSAFISNINSATRDSEEKQYHQNAAENSNPSKNTTTPKMAKSSSKNKEYYNCEFVPNTVRLPDCNVYKLNDTTYVPTVKNKRKLLVKNY